MKKLILLLFIPLLSFGQNKLHKEYYENGNVSSEIEMVEGILEGKALGYYESGEVQLEGFFKNDVPDGLFNQFYKDGKIKTIALFVDGKREGELKNFYENGELYSSIFYKNGIEDGDYKFYYNDGTLMEEGTNVKGRRIGLVKTYNRDGSVFRERNISANEKTVEEKTAELLSIMLDSFNLNPTNFKISEEKKVDKPSSSKNKSKGLFYYIKKYYEMQADSPLQSFIFWTLISIVLFIAYSPYLIIKALYSKFKLMKQKLLKLLKEK